MSTAAPPSVPEGVIRRGLGVLWVAVKEQPGIFAVAAVGSAVFAATTIAQAYVFGAITERVIVPGIEDGDIATSAMAVAFLAMLPVLAVFLVLQRNFIEALTMSSVKW